MKNFTVKVFQIPTPTENHTKRFPSKPLGLQKFTIKARTVDQVRRELKDRYAKQKRIIRSINFVSDTEVVVYLAPGASRART